MSKCISILFNSLIYFRKCDYIVQVSTNLNDELIMLYTSYLSHETLDVFSLLDYMIMYMVYNRLLYSSVNVLIGYLSHKDRYLNFILEDFQCNSPSDEKWIRMIMKYHEYIDIKRNRHILYCSGRDYPSLELFKSIVSYDVSVISDMPVKILVNACVNERFDILDHIFSLSSDLNREYVIYDICCYCQCEEVIILFLKMIKEKYKFNVKVACSHYYDPFIVCCEYNKLDVIKYLVEEEDIDISSRDNLGLVKAIDNDNYDIIEYLVNRAGIDVKTLVNIVKRTYDH